MSAAQPPISGVRRRGPAGLPHLGRRDARVRRVLDAGAAERARRRPLPLPQRAARPPELRRERHRTARSTRRPASCLSGPRCRSIHATTSRSPSTSNSGVTYRSYTGGLIEYIIPSADVHVLNPQRIRPTPPMAASRPAARPRHAAALATRRRRSNSAARPIARGEPRSSAPATVCRARSSRRCASARDRARPDAPPLAARRMACVSCVSWLTLMYFF